MSMPQICQKCLLIGSAIALQFTSSHLGWISFQFGNLIVMCILNFLLETEIPKVIKGIIALLVYETAVILMLVTKTGACNKVLQPKGILLWFPLFILSGSKISETKCSTPFLSRQLKAWRLLYSCTWLQMAT